MTMRKKKVLRRKEFQTVFYASKGRWMKKMKKKLEFQDFQIFFLLFLDQIIFCALI